MQPSALPKVIKFSLLDRPQPDRTPLVPYIVKPKVFSVKECKEILAKQDDEQVWRPFVNRKTYTCNYPREWEYVNDEILERVDILTNTLNHEHWGIDIVGQYMYPRLLQYTRGFDMAVHVDYQPHCGEFDKLCSILMLSAPNEYKGGHLYAGDYMEKPVKLGQGDMIFFPTYLLHYVQRVTKGVRTTMTFWHWGPAFR